MKKDMKKLVLAKETVGSLKDQNLAPAYGGSLGLLTCDPYVCYEMFASERNC